MNYTVITDCGAFRGAIGALIEETKQGDSTEFAVYCVLK
jgi:hypothetical protein